MNIIIHPPVTQLQGGFSLVNREAFHSADFGSGETGDWAVTGSLRKF